MAVQIKNYDKSYLYNQSDYGSTLYEYIIRSERVDKSIDGFENIRYLIKRNQTSSCLSKLLDRQSIELMLPEKPLFRSFKVFSAADVKQATKTPKVFIDVSGIIRYDNGEYIIKNADVEKLISYLACALSTLIYHSDPKLITGNTEILNKSNMAFAKMCTNVIDYMRIGTVDNIREKMMYMSSLYYQMNVLGKDDDDSTNNRAMSLSKITKKDADVIRVQMPEAAFENIDTFVTGISKVLRVPTLKTENFVDKWLFLYGSGTQFAMEIFPAFANMLMNAYVGAYLVNQKQIEKLIGREMIDFCTAIFKLGGELL